MPQQHSPRTTHSTAARASSAANSTRVRAKINSTATRKAARTERADDTGTAREVAFRSMWKGVISFGMVTIPVHMLPATASKDLAFHLLHAKCSTRLKQVRWCPTCKREVEWNDTVRGYEYAKGQYVVLTDSDFESIPRPTRHTIELTAFVKLDEIDPIYFEKSYYLDPEPAAGKSYALLVAALEQKQLTAIGRIAIRERERLCALRVADGAIMLETLYYADELRGHADTGHIEVSERELDMALKLIDYLTEEFHPEKFKDEYRDAVLGVIEAKLNNKEIVQLPESHDEKIINLMDALKASLTAAQSKRGTPAPTMNSEEQHTTRASRKSA